MLCDDDQSILKSLSSDKHPDLLADTDAKEGLPSPKKQSAIDDLPMDDLPSLPAKELASSVITIDSSCFKSPKTGDNRPIISMPYRGSSRASVSTVPAISRPDSVASVFTGKRVPSLGRDSGTNLSQKPSSSGFSRRPSIKPKIVKRPPPLKVRNIITLSQIIKYEMS